MICCKSLPRTLESHYQSQKRPKTQNSLLHLQIHCLCLPKPKSKMISSNLETWIFRLILLLKMIWQVVVSLSTMILKVMTCWLPLNNWMAPTTPISHLTFSRMIILYWRCLSMMKGTVPILLLLNMTSLVKPLWILMTLGMVWLIMNNYLMCLRVMLVTTPNCECCFCKKVNCYQTNKISSICGQSVPEFLPMHFEMMPQPWIYMPKRMNTVVCCVMSI